MLRFLRPCRGQKTPPTKGSAPDPPPEPGPGFCGRGLLTPTAAVSRMAAPGPGPVAAKAAPTGSAPAWRTGPEFSHRRAAPAQVAGRVRSSCGRGLLTPTAAVSRMAAPGPGPVAAKAAPTGIAPDPQPEPGFCGRGLLTPTAAVSREAPLDSGSVAARAAPAGNRPTCRCRSALPHPAA